MLYIVKSICACISVEYYSRRDEPNWRVARSSETRDQYKGTMTTNFIKFRNQRFVNRSELAKCRPLLEHVLVKLRPRNIGG